MIHIESRDEAQKAPTPITNYALFYDGEYVTNEQMNDKIEADVLFVIPYGRTARKKILTKYKKILTRIENMCYSVSRKTVCYFK